MMMEYKGYYAQVELSVEDQCLYGSVINSTDQIAFEAPSAKELIAEFATSIDDYLQFCMEQDIQPEKPYSGKFQVRAEPTLHRDLIVQAATEKRSMNDLAVEAIQLYLDRKKSA
ncbi:MAG: type II toxin-antitoxin system HicB family antitoxin [Oligoflexus sp.]|nr:type II toxin-antitoxin system HicB family antitoxin [Oligoflexus sp.]